MPNEGDQYCDKKSEDTGDYRKWASNQNPVEQQVQILRRAIDLKKTEFKQNLEPYFSLSNPVPRYANANDTVIRFENVVANNRSFAQCLLNL